MGRMRTPTPPMPPAARGTSYGGLPKQHETGWIGRHIQKSCLCDCQAKATPCSPCPAHGGLQPAQSSRLQLFPSQQHCCRAEDGQARSTVPAGPHWEADASAVAQGVSSVANTLFQDSQKSTYWHSRLTGKRAAPLGASCRPCRAAAQPGCSSWRRGKPKKYQQVETFCRTSTIKY